MTDDPAGLAARFLGGDTFDDFLNRPFDNIPLWRAIYRGARIPDDLSARVSTLGRRWNLLVLNEDWCGDAVNILPYLAKLAGASDNIELRIIRRDENLDLMDAHLTGVSRSIPVVIALDESYSECGWWGPRPGELQKWVLSEGLALPKAERYKLVRSWYARDRGVTTMSEVVAMLERCGASRS